MVIVLLTYLILALSKCYEASTKSNITIMCDSSKHHLDDPNSSCMDGTKPAYYFRKGHGSGLNKWHVHFEGGGWCYDYQNCLKRTQTNYGSSSNYQNCFNLNGRMGYFSTSSDRNPVLYNYNVAYVRYCDGSSYAGNTDVIYDGKKIQFRGMINRQSTIENLLRIHGMNNATDVLISGCSAGALGVLLGIDQMTTLIKASNPKIKVKALADSGYFLDYKSGNNWKESLFFKVSEEAIINGTINYSKAMRNVFTFTNMSAGTNVGCVDLYKLSNDKSRCIFAQYVTPFIRTPVFAIQSKFDFWQLRHVLGDFENISLVNSFGEKLREKLVSFVKYRKTHAVYIDSCNHHCLSCSFNSEDIWRSERIISSEKNHTIGTAFINWYTGLERNVVVHEQSRQYPCKDCCKCSMNKSRI